MWSGQGPSCLAVRERSRGPSRWTRLARAQGQLAQSSGLVPSTVAVHSPVSSEVSGEVDVWTSSVKPAMSSRLPAPSRRTIFSTLPADARSWRSQRSTVVHTVRQGERMVATTETVANYNHCHAITIQYFEVLRHLLVRQRLTDVQEFEQVVVRANPDGSIVRVRDIGRVELGAQSSDSYGRLNGSPGAILYVAQAPGANAVAVAQGVRTTMDRLAEREHARRPVPQLGLQVADPGGLDRGNQLVDVDDRGRLRVDGSWFAYQNWGGRRCGPKYHEAFGRPRERHEPIEPRHRDVAAAGQGGVHWRENSRRHEQTGGTAPARLVLPW